MKQKITFLLLLALVMMLAAAPLSHAKTIKYSNPIIYYLDDFNRPNSTTEENGWSYSGDINKQYVSNQELVLEDPDGSAQIAENYITNFVNLQYNNITFTTRSNDVTKRHLIDLETPANQGPIRLQFRNTALEAVTHAGNVEVMRVYNNVNYTITVYDINFTTDTYSLLIKNSSSGVWTDYGSFAHWYTTTNDLYRFSFVTDTTDFGFSAYIDDITYDPINNDNVSITLTNHSSYNTKNFTKNLRYHVNFTDCESKTVTGTSVKPSFYLRTLINDVVEDTNTVVCGSEYNFTYVLSNESKHTIYYYIESTTGPFYNGTFLTESYDFYGDLYPPNASLIVNTGSQGVFSSDTNISVSLSCDDSAQTSVFYNFTVNNVTSRSGIINNGIVINHSFATNLGEQNLSLRCNDTLYTSTNSTSIYVYASEISIIDEIDNVPFNVSNTSSIRIYSEDNASYYDFKLNGKTAVNYTSLNNTKLRLEIIYSDDRIINRWIDLSLINDEIRICANTDNVVHYEQFIISSQSRGIVLRNMYSNCYVGADYTRFAYQNGLLLKAYTIPVLYYLYTHSDGNLVYLASVDGGTASYIDLDNLELSQTDYNLVAGRDSLKAKKYSDTEMQIYYKNLANDLSRADISITRMDTNVVVFDVNEVSNPNEFTVYFPFNTLSNITNDTLFKVIITKYDSDDVTSEKSTYFNVAGGVGSISNGMAFVFSIICTLLALTFTSSRLSFGWFGLFMILISWGIASMSVGAWYITFLNGMNAILFLFIAITLFQKNYTTVI